MSKQIASGYINSFNYKLLGYSSDDWYKDVANEETVRSWEKLSDEIPYFCAATRELLTNPTKNSVVTTIMEILDSQFDCTGMYPESDIPIIARSLFLCHYLMMRRVHLYGWRNRKLVNNLIVIRSPLTYRIYFFSIHGLNDIWFSRVSPSFGHHLFVDLLKGNCFTHSRIERSFLNFETLFLEYTDLAGGVDDCGTAVDEQIIAPSEVVENLNSHLLIREGPCDRYVDLHHVLKAYLPRTRNHFFPRFKVKFHFCFECEFSSSGDPLCSSEIRSFPNYLSSPQLGEFILLNNCDDLVTPLVFDNKMEVFSALDDELSSFRFNDCFRQSDEMSNLLDDVEFLNDASEDDEDAFSAFYDDKFSSSEN
jgi:hypothetical protein